MKKLAIKIVIGVLLLITLFFMLYNNISKFNNENVESISLTVDEKRIVLDRESNSTNDLISRLVLLKQYKTIENPNYNNVYRLTLDMKFGEDKVFDLYLDYNFEEIYILDVENDITYIVDDSIVKDIYMLDILDEIYVYKNPESHNIIINDSQVVARNKSVWNYVKGDNQWYDVISEEDVDFSLVITEREVDFNIEYSAIPETSILSVYYDEKEIYVADIKEGFFIPESNGDYNYFIKSSWAGELFNGNYTSEIIVSCEYPPEFSISKTEIELGEYAVITAENISNPELLFIEQEVAGGVSFIKNGEKYECVIPATYYTTTGIYEIKYGVEGLSEYKTEIEVKDREFSIQYLKVSSSTEASTRTTEAYAEYNKYYKPALLENVYETKEEFIGRSNFVLPVNGRLTTEFGEQRYVNGAPTSYHHAGYDLAAPTGTDIKATYAGQVVLAKELILTGNSIVINHGNSIFSTYFHLNDIYIETGKNVETGDIIGSVGSTGFSTGPHLHFSISYYNMNLEPGYFIYGEKVMYENYKELFSK